MKFIRYLKNNNISYGIVEGNIVTQLKDDFFFNLEKSNLQYNIDEITLLAPIESRKIICVGLNYCDHIKEMNMTYPDEPVIFLKSSTSLIGANGEIIKIKSLTNRVDFEGELAMVVKKRAKNVCIEDAEDYIFGYTIANDVTARDIQDPQGQWTIAKSFDTFAPIGPWIETEVNTDSLIITTHVNGELKQASNTKEMLFKPKFLISYLSQFMTLEAKDIVLCGTPANVGELKNHDIVSVSIERIGVLTNTLIEV